MNYRKFVTAVWVALCLCSTAWAAGELSIAYTTEQTVKAIVWGPNKTTRWNGSNMVAPSTIAIADWATGQIDMTEQETQDGVPPASSTGQYVGDFPATGVVGVHQIDYIVSPVTVGKRRFGFQAYDNSLLSSAVWTSAKAGFVDAAITSRLAPTTASRTLDVAATGEAGLDFNNINAATGATTLTNITVPSVTLTDTVTTLTNKTGFALASDGLDSISTTEPAGVASNYREMVVQTWRRWFKKTTLTSTQLKTHKDDDSVATTQSATDASGTQTLGVAE